MSVIDTAIQQDLRQQFRLYSRQVLTQPQHLNAHKHRIQVALKLEEREPLQGAMIDFFYAFQAKLPPVATDWLQQAQPRLYTYVYQHLTQRLQHTTPSEQHNTERFATRWSVLTTPSMAAASHQMRTSRDASLSIAKALIEKLLQARQQQQHDLIVELQYEFFQHCLVCNDRVAFLFAWLKLSQQGWQFDAYWKACSAQLNTEQDHVNFHDFIQLSSTLKGAE